MEINKIYCENCIKTMSRMQDKYIDLVVTSPPYDNIRNYQRYNFNFETTIKNLYRVVKEGGVVVWVVKDQTINGSESGSSFKHALCFLDNGFKLHDTMIYEKNGMVYPDTVRYYDCFEFMFVFCKGKPKTINLITDRKNANCSSMITATYRQKDGSLKKGNIKIIKEYGVRNNIWKYNTGWRKSYDEEYLKAHPAIFPEKLVRDHIISWSNKGDMIYDPFMGSGTTAKVSIELDRKYIGSEISQKYVKIAKKRIEVIQTSLKIKEI